MGGVYIPASRFGGLESPVDMTSVLEKRSIKIHPNTSNRQSSDYYSTLLLNPFASINSRHLAKNTMSQIEKFKGYLVRDHQLIKVSGFPQHPVQGWLN